MSYNIKDLREAKVKMKAVIDEIRGIRTDVLGIPVLRPRLEEVGGGGAQPFGILSRLTETRGQPSRQEMYEETAERPVQTQEVRPAEMLNKKIPFLGQGQRATPLLDLVKQKTIRSAVKNIITGYTSGVSTQPQEVEEKKPGDEYEEKRKRWLEHQKRASIEM